MSSPSQPGDFAQLIEAFERDCERIVAQIRSVIVGHHSVIDEIMACLLAGGHALLEGVPGLGKTLLVNTLADALDLTFGRIQFTPDLMPSDITGTNILVSDADGGKSFEFEPGPVFANLILADEINRATPKTQSALLEAMQEQTVSVSRTSHKLPRPFMVLATQNPLEMEGTYPLPEAQLDRFMLKIDVSSSSVEELASIISRTTGSVDTRAKKVSDGSRILQMRSLVREVAVASHVANYIARLVLATDPRSDLAPPAVKNYVRYGASPRGAQAIVMAAKVRALREGRANVAFADVGAVAAPALRHRLILSFDGLADGVRADSVINEAIQAVPQAEAN